MSYSAPHTFTVGEVATAANLNLLTNDVTALLTATAVVDTSETTTSTTYADLATVGPTVTMNTGDRTEVWVAASCRLSNSGAGAICRMSVAVSGATTVAANDLRSLIYVSPAANNIHQGSTVFKFTGLTAGSNTFTNKYNVSATTGTFVARKIIVGL